MVVYDDIESLEKVRLYDRGVEPPPVTGFGEFQLSYRYGGITIPHLPSIEPLRAECEHFLDCIATGKTPLTDGRGGLQVVRVLETADASLHDGGGMYPIRGDFDRLVSDSAGSPTDLSWTPIVPRARDRAVRSDEERADVYGVRAHGHEPAHVHDEFASGRSGRAVAGGADE
jgi:hypothetical protein